MMCVYSCAAYMPGVYDTVVSALLFCCIHVNTCLPTSLFATHTHQRRRLFYVGLVSGKMLGLFLFCLYNTFLQRT